MIGVRLESIFRAPVFFSQKIERIHLQLSERYSPLFIFNEIIRQSLFEISMGRDEDNLDRTGSQV